MKTSRQRAKSARHEFDTWDALEISNSKWQVARTEEALEEVLAGGEPAQLLGLRAIDDRQRQYRPLVLHVARELGHGGSTPSPILWRLSSNEIGS